MEKTAMQGARQEEIVAWGNSVKHHNYSSCIALEREIQGVAAAMVCGRRNTLIRHQSTLISCRVLQTVFQLKIKPETKAALTEHSGRKVTVIDCFES